MCLLTYFPIGIEPNIEALFNGAEYNSDGHGYAIVAGDRIIVRKSMDPAKLIEEFAKQRARHLNGPALFHSRIATAGTVNKFNCHPFKVGGDSRVVVAHNGILPASVQPPKGDLRCDTRIFADTHLPYRNLDSSRSRRKLEKWLGGDKLVVLSVNPRHRQSAYLMNEKCGHWDDELGIWYSNYSYQPAYSYGRSWGYGYGATVQYRRNSAGEWVRIVQGDDEDPYDDWSTFNRQKDPVACFSPKLQQHNHYLADVQDRCDNCVILSGEFVVPVETVPTVIGSTRPRELLPTRAGLECTACGTYGSVSAVTQICTLCWTCQECLGNADEKLVDDQHPPCLCFTPSRLRMGVADYGHEGLDELDEEAIDAAIRQVFAEEGTDGGEES